jgi:Tfp pilus assembly protein PilX
MTRRLRDERGSALIAAIILCSVMIVVGLGIKSLADGQERESGRDRARDAAFQQTEAAMQHQVFQVSRRFPLSPTDAYPAAGCTPATAGTVQCPDATAMNVTYASGDYTARACPAGVPTTPWRTWVNDNTAPRSTYYSSAVTSRPTYDENGDGAVWVRSEGVAGCRVRAIVTQVKVSDIPLPFPRNALTANWFRIPNSGRKIMIDTVGAFAKPPSARPPGNRPPAAVSVRCQPPLGFTPCNRYTDGQVVQNTTEIANSQSPVLNAAQLVGLRLRAQSKGTYYASGCPPNLTGEIVYVMDLTGCPAYRGGNSADAPGVVVVERGTLTFTGNAEFFGIVYMLNKQGTTGAVVSTQGTALVQGAVAVDGLGGVVLGSSRTNLVYDPRAFDLIKGIGGATAVPNTWRELTAGQ